MVFEYPPKRQNPKKQRLASKGFPDGWNSLPHASSLKDTELAELTNGVYSQYGSISKRQGSLIIGDARAGSTKVINAGMFYDIGDEDYMLRITDTGEVERFNFDTNVWELLTATPPVGYSDDDPTFTSDSPVFDPSVFVNMVQANGKIYFSSELDRVVIFDGTDWKVYAELADPTGFATVVKTGAGTGTRSYYYRWIEMNEFGHTAGSPAITTEASGTGWIEDMPEIDGSTYTTVTLPAAVAGTTRRVLYRGDVGGSEFYLADLEAGSTEYVDKNVNPNGVEGTSVAFVIPEENNTPGYHFYLMDVFANSIVGTTVEEGKDVLVISAGADAKKIGATTIDTFDSFSLADGAGFDGYQRGDGQSINAIQSFSVANKDGLAIFKDRRTGLMEFDAEGGINIQNVNVIRGTMSPLAPHVAGNNIRFYSSEGPASIGHEENYGTILRYSVLGLKADSVIKSVHAHSLPIVCSEYYQNLSLFGISTSEGGGGGVLDGNDSILIYDERYNTWSHWTGLHPAVFFKGIHPTTKIEDLYMGVGNAEETYGGNVVKMFTGKTDYATSSGSGTKITLSITTKQYDAGLPDQFKKFDKVVLIFGSLVGDGTTVGVLNMGTDGLDQFPRYRISTSATLSGFGDDEWGTQEFGMMQIDDAGDTLNLRYVNLRQKDLFWVKINIQEDSVDGEITLIGIAMYYSQSQRQLPSRSRITTLA